MTTIEQRMAALLESSGKKEYFYLDYEKNDAKIKKDGIPLDRRGRIDLWKDEDDAVEFGEQEYEGVPFTCWYVELDPSEVEQDPREKGGVIAKKPIPFEAVTDWWHPKNVGKLKPKYGSHPDDY